MTNSTCDHFTSPDTRIIRLHSECPLQAADDAALPAVVNDLPAFHYWKDAIGIGHYVHPYGTFTLDVTRDTLQSYLEAYQAMKANGVAVPIVMDHQLSADATLGWIVDMRLENDRLLELHQFLGEESREVGLRNLVSLGIDPDFVDGQGNHYGPAIVHSAITPVPVVNGQGAFVAEEADDTVIPLMLDRRKRSETPIAPKSAAPALPQVKAATSGKTPSHDDSTRRAAELVQRALGIQVHRSVESGALTPAVANELQRLLLHDRGADRIDLSYGESDGTGLALAIFDLLASNRSTPCAERTGLQLLSRPVPDDSTGPLQRKMISLASGK